MILMATHINSSPSITMRSAHTLRSRWPEFRTRFGNTQPATSKEQKKCFACCCQRFTLSGWTSRWWKQAFLVDKLWRCTFASRNLILDRFLAASAFVNTGQTPTILVPVSHTRTHTHMQREIANTKVLPEAHDLVPVYVKLWPFSDPLGPHGVGPPGLHQSCFVEK